MPVPDRTIVPEGVSKTKLVLAQGDITTQAVDAIVNAANESLLGGEGVDGAIHDAAGPELFDACWELHGCITGQAVITPGFNLPAKHVIHTVGPIYHDDTHIRIGREHLLESCYRTSIALAEQHGLKSIAFPAISTGDFGYPKEEAAQIVSRTIADVLSNGTTLQEIRFVLFTAEDFQIYKRYFPSAST